MSGSVGSMIAGHFFAGRWLMSQGFFFLLRFSCLSSLCVVISLWSSLVASVCGIGVDEALLEIVVKRVEMNWW